MRKLTHKGYGRIYIDDMDNIPIVHEVMKEIDESEFNNYLPEDLIAPFTNYPVVVYTHKFSDMDMDKVVAECWKRGVFIWVFDTGHNEYA